MIVITAVDNQNGMQFNHRRQSRDRVMIQEVLRISENKQLWMHPYSASLFKDHADILIDEQFMEKAAPGDICFVENLLLSPFIDGIEQVILFHWNRNYPGDLFFDLDLTDGNWTLSQQYEFAGSSHENITVEVFVHA